MAEFNEEKLARAWMSSLVGGNTYSAPVIHPGFTFVDGRTPEQRLLYKGDERHTTFKSTKMKP